MMLMSLCLLVYNLGQRQLRIALKTQKTTFTMPAASYAYAPAESGFKGLELKFP
jgi:hypothetical protein